MRKLLWGVIALFGLIAVVLGVAYWQLDHIAQEAAERGTSYALGVESEVRSADVGLFTGRVALGGLKLHNPPGFKTPYLMANDTLTVEAETASIFSKVIRIPRIELDGLTLHIEQQQGKSNLQTVLDHLRRLGEKDGPVESPDSQRRLRVDRVVIRDIVAYVQTLPVGGEASTVTIRVPKMVFDDVASGEGEGVAVAELTRRLTPPIVLGVLNKGGELPTGLVIQLGGDVAPIVQQLGGDGRRILEQVGGPVAEGMVTALEKAVGTGGDVGELLGKTLDQTLGRALQQLLEGDSSER